MTAQTELTLASTSTLRALNKKRNLVLLEALSKQRQWTRQELLREFPDTEALIGKRLNALAYADLISHEDLIAKLKKESILKLTEHIAALWGTCDSEASTEKNYDLLTAQATCLIVPASYKLFIHAEPFYSIHEASRIVRAGQCVTKRALQALIDGRLLERTVIRRGRRVQHKHSFTGRIMPELRSYLSNLL